MMSASIEIGYWKYGWITLFLLNIILALLNIVLLIMISEPNPSFFQAATGMTWDQFIASSSNQAIARVIMDDIRYLGIYSAGTHILGAAIARTAFRNGERWAWYVSWFFPLSQLYSALVEQYRGASDWPLFAILFAVFLLALVLPARKFFPKKSRKT